MNTHGSIKNVGSSKDYFITDCLIAPINKSSLARFETSDKFPNEEC